MKSQLKNKTGLLRKNLNCTTNFTATGKVQTKKSNWKSKTTKMTKTLGGKALMTKPMMTEDDIEKLFKNHSRQKQSILVPTKVSTEVGQPGGFFENRDFVSSVKFLRLDDEIDKFLSGIPCNTSKQLFRFHDFSDSEGEDLTANFKKNYLVGKIIGQGAYASVRVAIYKPRQQKIALKIYEKSKIKEVQRKKSVRREIKILQLLNHPNIVKIHDVIQTNNHLNIAMEYLSGLSLGTYLKAQPNGKIPEKTCKKIFKQLTKSLAYMHDLHIAHRDIKLENIILDEDLNPKLIDFGFSTCIQPSDKVKIFCGTPSYMAPEVVERREYRGETADIWALGVLLFVSLTGIFPFKGATDEELFKKISVSEYPRSQLFQNKLALDLIEKMLKVNELERLTAHQMLNHSWFNEGRSSSSKKRQTEGSVEGRKRLYTLTSNQENQAKRIAKTNKFEKLKFDEDKQELDIIIEKKFLAETCKQNLNLQLRLALKSPTNKEITSFRKNKQPQAVPKQQNKQNYKFSFKNEKNTTKGVGLIKQSFVKQSAREHRQQDGMKKKQKTSKPHPKVIELLRMEIKKRQSEASKSKSNTHRN